MNENTNIGVVQDIKDPSRPETSEWGLTFTWASDESEQVPSPEEIRQEWKSRSLILSEPFKSIFLQVNDETKIWCERLSHWPTVPWDNRHGTVTLAGDAAHPMTYRELPETDNGWN